jgi:hypothetical protein
LINNAGGFYLKKNKISKDIDKTLMLNYYTPYFLIKNLILKNKYKKKTFLNILSHALPKKKISISNLSEQKNLVVGSCVKFQRLLY